MREGRDVRKKSSADRQLQNGVIPSDRYERRRLRRPARGSHWKLAQVVVSKLPEPATVEIIEKEGVGMTLIRILDFCGSCGSCGSWRKSQKASTRLLGLLASLNFMRLSGANVVERGFAQERKRDRGELR
jgi:hypothetical protein